MAGLPADEPIWQRYDELLPRARVKALEDATGQSVHRERADQHQDDACRPMFEDEAFPQLWILIHFFARAALRRTLNTGVFDFPAPTPEELQARATEDRRLDDEARGWLERSRAAPHDAAPSDAVRRAFRDWASDIQRPPGSVAPGFYALMWSRMAVTCAIRAWARNRALAMMIPPSVYRCAAGTFQPGSIRSSGDEDWYDLRFEQMLGHAPAAQDAKPADDPEVCLLNLASGGAMGWSFGDDGDCSFWITPQDLASRDFSRVYGRIEGH